MAKKSQPTSSSKFTRVFEYDHATAVWTYDYAITRNGPVSVEITYNDEKKRKTKK